MIYNNVELHNFAEAVEVPGEAGVRLQRVPESVRTRLEAASDVMLVPAGSEIRFVTDGPTARVTLSCGPAGSGSALTIVPFFGQYDLSQRFTVREGDGPQTLEITMPEGFRSYIEQLEAKGEPFSPRVCRLMVDYGGVVHFHGAEGEGIRPPKPAELPKVRCISYGTSITHGAAATGPHLSYVQQAARRLGVDVTNLGVGGTAFCEPALADYIASRDDWHFATLALSVNMVGGFSREVFRERVTYMVNTVAGADTSRPVACITIYPYAADFDDASDPEGGGAKSSAFRQILRDAVAECPHPNVHIIEGSDILTDFGGLTCDLIHPADNGMIQMGENLAQRLRPLLASILA